MFVCLLDCFENPTPNAYTANTTRIRIQWQQQYSMLFSFLPSVPLGILKVTTALVVLTALAHQFKHAVKHVTMNNAIEQSHNDFFRTTSTRSATAPTAKIRNHQKQNLQGNNSAFGACLLVKDDNDLLYEWIAYHYTIMPLRFLVVGVDVNSTQDPSDVLQRWRDADTDLQYWVLNASEFDIYTTDASNRKQRRRQQQTVVSKNRNRTFLQEEKDREHHALITRQKGFVTMCSRLLKEQGVRWTTYIDSDEFVVPNILTPEDKLLTVDGSDHYSIRNESLRIRGQLLQPIGSASSSSTTVLDVLLQMQSAEMVQACYTVPRLIVGALENQTCPEAQSVKDYYTRTIGNSSYDNMSTLRFVQHSKKGDFAQNKFGKVFMDLSRIPRDDLVRRQPPSNIHRPYREYCGPGAVHFPNAVFYLNHYIGSWERYSSRSSDRRRNRQEWEQRAYFNDGIACETKIHQWLSRFVALVGEARARVLLGALPHRL